MQIGRLSMAAVAASVLLAACSGGTATTTTSSSTSTSSPSVTATTSTTTTTVPRSTTTTAAAPTNEPATATIVIVQQNLEALGYFDGVTDGIAGEVTKAALAKFQADASIEIDGVFGAQTDEALTAALQKNEKYVTELQEFLVEKQLYPGPIDGDYGKGTTRAVKAFQKSCDIEETGLINIATRLCVAGT